MRACVRACARSSGVSTEDLVLHDCALLSLLRHVHHAWYGRGPCVCVCVCVCVSMYSGEIKMHPWFEGVDWTDLARSKAAFVPQLDDDEDTSYFEKKPVSAKVRV